MLLPRRYFLERLFAFSEFLHITYTKSTTLIKGPFGTPGGSHESTRQRRGSGATFCASSIIWIMDLKIMCWYMDSQSRSINIIAVDLTKGANSLG
jgi:hypothetical protein